MKKSLGSQALVHPTPVFVVGTYDLEGQPDVTPVSWAGICCSQPPCIAVAFRQATLTHANITRQRAFTVGVPSENQARQVDYCGSVSGKTTDKFAATGWTAVKSERVNAPYVEEISLILECRLVHAHQLGLHTQFVGEILDVKVEEEVLGDQNTPDLKKLRPLVFAPDAHAYYRVGDFVGHAFSIGDSLPASDD